MSPRPQMEHIRKPQILLAAAEVITERGLAGTRIADVADRARTSPAAVLYWFADREELLNEALGAAEDRFYDSLTDRLDELAGPGERLRLLIETSVDAYDWTLWMELWTRALRDDAARETRERLDGRWRAEIAKHVRDGRARGELGGHYSPEQVAVVFAALLDGLALQATLGDGEVPPERMRQLALEGAERLLGGPLPTLDQAIDRERVTLAEGESA